MSGSWGRVDQSMNHYYTEESAKQGWQQQPDITRQGRGQNWTGGAAGTAQWVNAAPVGYQLSTFGEGWNIETKYGFDHRAVPDHQYPQVASDSTPSEVSVNGNLPQSQGLLDRSGMLLAPGPAGVPYQFTPYNPRFVYHQSGRHCRSVKEISNRYSVHEV